MPSIKYITIIEVRASGGCITKLTRFNRFPVSSYLGCFKVRIRNQIVYNKNSLTEYLHLFVKNGCV